jgi:hypothetical protein
MNKMYNETEQLGDFEKAITERMALPSTAFRPFAHHDADCDSLEFLVSDENFYAEPFDNLVTVYYGQESGDVVGLLFKKIKKFFEDFLKNAPGFKAEIKDHRIKVESLFTAKIWSSSEGPDDARILIYKQLREVAKENDVETEIDDLAELVA